MKDSLQGPVKGADFYVDSIKTPYFTNKRGIYKIKVKSDAKKILVFSRLKGTSETNIDGRTTINFTLSGYPVLPPYLMKNVGTEETVEVGYGTMKKRDVISGKASSNSPRFSSYTNMYDMIRNEVPGVQVQGTSIFLQGQSTFGGSSEPLLVVDGVIVEQINDVAPSDVNSIQVLKGPSAAVYGMRGANGVIFIKTKRGSDK